MSEYLDEITVERVKELLASSSTRMLNLLKEHHPGRGFTIDASVRFDGYQGVSLDGHQSRGLARYIEVVILNARSPLIRVRYYEQGPTLFVSENKQNAACVRTLLRPAADLLDLLARFAAQENDS